MKRKLIPFSALLIMFLLAGTAGAIGDTENTDAVSVSATGPSVTLISLADLAVVNMTNPLIFNFTSQDANPNLSYQVYLDGEPVVENGFGNRPRGDMKKLHIQASSLMVLRLCRLYRGYSWEQLYK